METFEVTNIEPFSNIPELIPYHVISGQHRGNILFSYKEAINNIILHAMASEVSILFDISANTFTILIQDNGKGMSVQLLQNSTGNGLFNMQQRLKEIGGTCTITPTSKGTTILFSTKLV